MAEEKAIDPNDLDSIDALLDEAVVDGPEVTIDPGNVDDIDSLLDEATFDAPESEITKSNDNAAEQVVVEDIETDAKNLVTPVVPVVKDIKNEARNKTADKVLKKRTQDKKNKLQNGPSEAEVTEIKKLIIIFGSIITALVFIAVIIGVWAALSSGSLDENTTEQFNTIETEVTESLLQTKASADIINNLEKKIDGLSYKIKQIDTEILKMLSLFDTEKSVLNLTDTKQVNEKKSTPAKTLNINNNEMSKKIDTLSSRVLSTQRRVNEMNKRTKALQSQNKNLLKNIKNLEKQMLQQQLNIGKVKILKEETKKALKEQGISADAYRFISPHSTFDARTDYFR